MAESTRLQVACVNCGGVFALRFQLPPDATLQGNWHSCFFCGHLVRVPDGVLSDLVRGQPEPRGRRDIKFSGGVHAYGREVHQSLEKALTGIETPNLYGPAASFLSNVFRLQALMELPVQTTWLARKLEGFGNQALFELTGALHQAPPDEATQTRVRERSTELALNWFKQDTQLLNDDVERFGVNSLEGLLVASRGPAMWLGLEAILSAQVTGMWTAFEVLAGDLWEAALNAHPHGLADLKGRRKKGKSKPKQPTADEADEAQGQDADRRLSVSRTLLQKFGYDLKNHWGTVLKPDLSSLSAVREAYTAAFFEQPLASIETAIDHECFRKLSAVRNAIVHTGGIADQAFYDDTRGLSAFSQIAIGSRIPVDGPMVASLVTPAIENCCLLIKGVDAWIVSHREKSRR